MRALELKVKGNPEPELIPNEETVINLEHVLPQRPLETGWNHIHPNTAEAVYKRLGNMVLLQASKNSEIGNKSFEDKRPMLKSSQYLLTSMVADETEWNVEQIDGRQKKLAELALQTWPAR